MELKLYATTRKKGAVASVKDLCKRWIVKYVNHMIELNDNMSHCPHIGDVKIKDVKGQYESQAFSS